MGGLDKLKLAISGLEWGVSTILLRSLDRQAVTQQQVIFLRYEEMWPVPSIRTFLGKH